METETFRSKGRIIIEVDNITQEETKKYEEIFGILAASGVLRLKSTGVIIHIDKDSIFQGIELQGYWPWRRIKEELRENRLHIDTQPREDILQ